jgi:hypothetical protein
MPVFIPCFIVVLLFSNPAVAQDCFRINLVDEDTGRGVPLVELRTVNHLRYVTDSNGLIAFFEPGLMDREVFFHIESHGYEFPADGFGIRGRKLKTTPGGAATLKIKRINIAERLYRVTGAGIYRDTVLAGNKPPIEEPVLNGQVFGSDSVQSTIYKGRMIWFWGDTNRPSYPLGNFHVPCATSLLPENGGLDPRVGVDLKYLVDESGFARATCRMPGSGPTWIDGLVNIHDENGNERLFAKYVKVAPPLSVYEQGIVEFDDVAQQFEKRLVLDKKLSVVPFGHSFEHREPGSDRSYIYFADPYALVRVPSSAEAILDPSQYESYSYFKPYGGDHSPPQLDRTEAGELRLSWKPGARRLDSKLEDDLFRSGQLKQSERFFQFVESATGKSVVAHRGTIAFNRFLKRWVILFTEVGGTSMLGEVWCAQARDLTGPWQKAVKIATHRNYSFYNPRHHPTFDQEQGRFLYFEGTYTTTFSGNEFPTQRYDYNQIMYRLDLSDPRLEVLRQ